MTYIELIQEQNPNALTIDGFDDCIIGIASRCSKESLLAYDRKKCIKKLMKRDKMPREDAEEFFEFNIAGAWVGEGTPLIIDSQL